MTYFLWRRNCQKTYLGVHNVLMTFSRLLFLQNIGRPHYSGAVVCAAAQIEHSMDLYSSVQIKLDPNILYG